MIEFTKNFVAGAITALVAMVLLFFGYMIGEFLWTNFEFWITLGTVIFVIGLAIVYLLTGLGIIVREMWNDDTQNSDM